MFFNPYEMARTGNYRGIPLYVLTTRDPYGVVYLPVARGLMQPYERRRDGDAAGTVGNSAPSFPVDRDSEATLPDSGLQAQGPPDLSWFGDAASYGATDDRSGARSSTGTGSVAPAASRPAGPLTTALKPTGLNAFYIEYRGPPLVRRRAGGRPRSRRILARRRLPRVPGLRCERPAVRRDLRCGQPGGQRPVDPIFAPEVAGPFLSLPHASHIPFGRTRAAPRCGFAAFLATIVPFRWLLIPVRTDGVSMEPTCMSPAG